MATIYSLVCFGGRLGKPVTFTDLGDVVNLTRHGLRDGTGVVFSTTGVLPTGLTAGTTYYSKLGADSGKFTLWTDATLTTQVTFTGTGSGTHTVKGAYRNGLTTDQLLRYGDPGSERIYDGMENCRATQTATATTFDAEAWEIGEDFIDDRNSSGMAINMPSPVLRIYPINGAGHNGVYGTGYTLLSSTTSISNPVITLSSQIELSGITAQITGLGGSGVQVAHPLSVVDSCIVIGGGTSGGNSYGIKAGGVYCQYTNNLVKGFKRGFELYQNNSRQVIAHNIATGNDIGFYPMTTASYFGFYYNNIGIGNVTANWGAQPAGITGAGSNCGLSGDTTWNTSPNSAITIATTDFINYAGNDFSPASSSSPQVDSAVEYYQIINTDIAGAERPNYNNGGAEGYDCGCYEFDNGYGPHPVSVERGLAFTGLISGSEVKVFQTGTQTTVFSDTSSATSETWSESVSGSTTVDYTVMKDGYLPIRVTGITVTGADVGGVLSTPIQQVVDRSYVTPSGLTMGSTATYNAGTKRFTVTTATTVQNWYSFMVQAWRTEATLANVAFPLSANGPNSFQLADDWQFSSGISYLSRDGLRYLDSSSVVTDVWAAILSVGVPAGMTVRYQQTDGGTTQSATNAGNMDQLIKIYEDGAFDYTGWLVLKVQGDGYDQAEFDAYVTYGTLEDQLYVVGLTPTANGISADTVTGITITDHGASPVTWNSKAFSITITDTTGHTGEQILQYVRGLNDFDYHDLVQTNGTEYKTVRGKLYGDTGASIKGARVVQADGTTSHVDFNLHTADDGTSYIPPLPPAAVTATVLADTRVQLFNVTTDTEIDNDFITGTIYNYVITSEASAGDTIRLRACKMGREAGEAFGIWSGTPLPLLISQPEDEVYTAWGIDGSTCTEFVGDVTGHIYIDANDLDGVSQKVRLGAWYSWVLTLDIGIRHFYGAVSYVAVNAIRINTDIADMLIENINSTTALRFTDLDVRLYRSDGTSIIAPTSYSIHNDYSGVPDVSVVTVSGVNVITGDIADIPTDVWGHATRTLTTSAGGATADEVWSNPNALTVGKFLGLK